jgi:hypothetical protein
MAASALAIAAIGFAAVRGSATVVQSTTSATSWLLVVCGLGLATFFGAAIFVPFKPWGWAFASIAIAVGLPSIGFPFALALALQWTKPTTKAAFARL